MRKSAQSSQPKEAWLKEMRRAFYEARFSDAAAMYDGSRGMGAPYESVLLRARIYLKHIDAANAIVLLSTSPKQIEKQLEAERLMLLGVAHSRINQFEEADEFFARAEEKGASTFFRVEFLYFRGRRFLQDQKPRVARNSLTELRSIKSVDARLFGDLLESGIFSGEEHYRDAANVLAGLIQFIDDSAQPHIEERAHALGMLAMLARELDDANLANSVKLGLENQIWTDEFRVQQFQTLKAIGWCHALQGDYFNGLRYIKMAGSAAPSSAWRIMTLLDRAYLARCFGELHWSQDELAEADDLISSLNWRETRDEERVALLLAAELFAPLDSGKAASYLARFSELRDAISPLILSRYDRRPAALADYAMGIVDAHFGNRKAAVAKLTRAWEVYDDIRFDWRAGRAALRLYELTKEERWLSRASAKLKNYRGSWLWTELQSKLPKADNLPRLTPMQRRIAQMMYEGKTTKEICKETGTAPNTVQNHVKLILRAFNVPNRAAVVADLARRGFQPNAANTTSAAPKTGRRAVLPLSKRTKLRNNKKKKIG